MNPACFKIVNLQQGTQVWLDWRKQGIGASDAPTIMGENPWESADELLCEKHEGRNYQNFAMARGHKLEPEARDKYESKFGLKVQPSCLQSITHSWLRASVDGLAVDHSVVVEIKCGIKTYRESVATKSVPRYYYGQLQHILAVTNYTSIDYWCYHPSLPAFFVRIERDSPYIGRLLEVEAEFWKTLQKKRGVFEQAEQRVHGEKRRQLRTI